MWVLYLNGVNMEGKVWIKDPSWDMGERAHTQDERVQFALDRFPNVAVNRPLSKAESKREESNSSPEELPEPWRPCLKSLSHRQKPKPR